MWVHGWMMMMMEMVELPEPMVLAPRSSRCLKRPEVVDRVALVPKGCMARGCCHLMQMAKASRRAPRGCPAYVPLPMCANRVLPTSPYCPDRCIRAPASRPSFQFEELRVSLRFSNCYLEGE